MSRKWGTFFAAMLLVQATAWAERSPVAPKDFAQSIDIQLESGHPFYELELTEVVYLNLRQSNLGDIRIYNGANQPVPFAMQTAPHARTTRSTTKQSLLHFFPLYADKGRNLDDLRIHVNTTGEGSIVDIKVGNGKQDSPQKKRIAYLVDASAFKQPVSEFQLNWIPENADTQLVKLRLEYSDDLVVWKRINIDNVLARLEYKGYQLSKPIVRAGNTEAKYFRLSWPESRAGFTMQKLTAFSYAKMTEEPEFTWSTIKGIPDPDQANTFVYDTGGYLPAQRARIVLPAGLTAASASLESTSRLTTDPASMVRRRDLSDVVDPRRILRDDRSRRHGPYWRGHSYYKPVYDIEVSGVRLKSDDIRFYKTTDRYWRIRFNPDADQVTEAPELRLGWLPDKLLFLAAGKPPYRLLVGNDTAISRGIVDSALIHQMRNRDMQPAVATLGEASVQSAGQRKGGGKFSSNATLNWILWGVMGAGVLMLVWMTQRLLKQMAESKEDE